MTLLTRQPHCPDCNCRPSPHEWSCYLCGAVLHASIEECSDTGGEFCPLFLPPHMRFTDDGQVIFKWWGRPVQPFMDFYYGRMLKWEARRLDRP